ncbi:MAG: right-handed parallel beta-helix repeat-containing protein [Promethearchaeota archaeon]
MNGTAKGVGAHNWSWVQSQPWFGGGDGSKGNPYQLENITIDGQNSSSCIKIINSRDHFIINNCTLYNSSEGSIMNRDAGIYLFNTTNGQLVNNNCSLNYGLGIRIEESDNNALLSNNIADNSWGGILIDGSKNNTLSGNLIYELGIDMNGNSIEDYNSHTIDTTNLLNGKPIYYYTGKKYLGTNNFTNAGQIILVNCNDSLIINHDPLDGIKLAYCKNNTISNNNVSYNLNSIHLVYSYNNTIFNNTVNHNKGVGIATYVTYDNIISNNTINNNVFGIFLYDSENDTVLGNNVNNNKEVGILIGNTFNCTVTNNTAINNTLYGIRLGVANNSTVSHNNVSGSDYGISLDDCEKLILFNNTCENIDSIGIDLWMCSNITLFNNKMKSCGLNFYGSREEMSSHSIDTSNKVNEKPIYYYTNKIGLNNQNFSNAGQILLVNCNNSIISNLNISYTTYAITLDFCNNNNLTHNNISYNNGGGIILYSSLNNTVENNTIKNSGVAIVLHYDGSNSIINNELSYNNVSIAIRGSNNNMINENHIYKNDWGIQVLSSINNTFFANIISNNDLYGISLDSASNYSLIYNNEFIGNTINAMDNGTNNQWDNGSIGNYWDDYGGVDLDDNGIGDTPYYIPGTAGSQDNFPIWDDGPESKGDDDDDDDEKDKEEPSLKISGYNLYFLIGVMCAVSAILIKKRSK